MRVILPYLKVNILSKLQFRTSYFVGVITQICWALLSITIYINFFKNNIDTTITLQETVTYIWMQQAFFNLFSTWFLEKKIISSISQGLIVYELCRPINLYNIWFIETISSRISSTLLRAPFVFIVSFIVPEPYKISISKSALNFMLFLISLILAVILVNAIMMLIYASSFKIINVSGLRMITSSIIDFFSGSLVPIAFFPSKIQSFMFFSPFNYLQNIPFRMISGSYTIEKSLSNIIIQICWIIIFVIIGKLLINHGIKKIVIQGG